jgi:hypothetical protein
MTLDLILGIAIAAGLLASYYAGKIRAIKLTPKLLARMTIEEWRAMSKLVADEKARLDTSEALRQLEAVTAEYQAAKAEIARLQPQPPVEVAHA